MAETVVDALEMIHVEQDQRHGLPVSVASIDLDLHDAFVLCPVPGARQAIGGGLPFKFRHSGLQAGQGVDKDGIEPVFDKQRVQVAADLHDVGQGDAAVPGRYRHGPR